VREIIQTLLSKLEKAKFSGDLAIRFKAGQPVPAFAEMKPGDCHRRSLKKIDEVM